MNGLQISDVAERTGFSASALRFYEDAGLVVPGRAASGYRVYDERAVSTLRFVGRAKAIGLTIDEIRELVPLFEGDACAPVQDRLKDLVATKLVDAHRKVAELVAFTAELRRVADRLDAHTPEGACDDECWCAAGTESVPVELVPATADRDAIVCCLGGDDIHGAALQRIADWHALTSQAIAREPIAAGVRLRFDRSVDLAEMARLARAESDCCAWSAYRIGVDATGVMLDITGPDAARDVIEGFVA